MYRVLIEMHGASKNVNSEFKERFPNEVQNIGNAARVKSVEEFAGCGECVLLSLLSSALVTTSFCAVSPLCWRSVLPGPLAG